jgi:hypothetical protein
MLNVVIIARTIISFSLHPSTFGRRTTPFGVKRAVHEHRCIDVVVQLALSQIGLQQIDDILRKGAIFPRMVFEGSAMPRRLRLTPAPPIPRCII